MRDALALFVGRGRRYSVDAAAGAADIKPRTLKSYVEGKATPGLHVFLSLAAAMPLAWTNSILSLAGLRAERIEDDDVCAGSVMVTVARLNLALTEALEDGKLDHVERRILAPLLQQAITQQSALAKQLEGEGT